MQKREVVESRNVDDSGDELVINRVIANIGAEGDHELIQGMEQVQSETKAGIEDLHKKAKELYGK